MKPLPSDDCVIVLDFGSQYAQLIARRVREAGVYALVFPYDVEIQRLIELKPKGIIASGGPESVTQAEAQLPEAIWELGCPVLGICYSMQAMAVRWGGSVVAGQESEFGSTQVTVQPGSWLHQALRDKTDTLTVWMSHSDHVSQVPESFQVDASTSACPVVAMSHRDKPYYALQFHPEVTHTDQGFDIIKHFLQKICGCQATWTTSHMVESLVAKMRETVGDQQVILGLSGGVDSAVAAALLQRAIGPQLLCVFVDHGLLRKAEREQVEAAFAPMGLRLEVVDARHDFFQALAGVTDPEQKRKIIGREFVRAFQAQAKHHPEIRWLAQGTIYPDVIESAGDASGKAHVIKSHHNVGGLPEELHLSLVEPLRMLFKDEVRRLGLKLGLPSSLIERHPFPGPGLAVRVLGEVTPEAVAICQAVDAIFLDILESSGWLTRVNQAFAVLLPIKSVGVVGDARRYGHVVALRAVETSDFMTARWSHLPYEVLNQASLRILNQVPEVARVVYDISNKPAATIEWE